MPKTHQMFGTRIYRIWHNMKQRCNNPKHKSYKNYGGRGVRVCQKWNTFLGFFEDMKYGYLDSLTLERIDNNGNYSKENCRWATQQEQAINTSRCRTFLLEGKEYSLSGLARKYKTSFFILNSKIKNGEFKKEFTELKK